MANCKDCIHNEACNCWLSKENKQLLSEEGHICEHFKDRNKFIELPCKVGDTVYVLEYEDGEAVDYGGWIFLMANDNFALLSPIVNNERNSIQLCNYYFEKYVEEDERTDSTIIVPIDELYFTKQEAEKALEERENNG